MIERDFSTSSGMDQGTLGNNSSPLDQEVLAARRARLARESQQTSDRSYGLTERFARSARQNPVATAMVGAGLGWLVVRSLRPDITAEGRQWAKDKVRRVDDVAHRAGRATTEGVQRASRATTEGVQRVVSIAADRAEAAKDAGEAALHRFEERTEDLYFNNPLAFAGAAALAGLGLGLLLPETETENELLGPSRARVAERLDEMASHEIEEAGNRALERVSEVAERIVHPGEVRQ